MLESNSPRNSWPETHRDDDGSGRSDEGRLLSPTSDDRFPDASKNSFRLPLSFEGFLKLHRRIVV